MTALNSGQSAGYATLFLVALFLAWCAWVMWMDYQDRNRVPVTHSDDSPPIAVHPAFAAEIDLPLVPLDHRYFDEPRLRWQSDLDYLTEPVTCHICDAIGHRYELRDHDC